jgi:hypothetical protein
MARTLVSFLGAFCAALALGCGDSNSPVTGADGGSNDALTARWVDGGSLDAPFDPSMDVSLPCGAAGQRCCAGGGCADGGCCVGERCIASGAECGAIGGVCSAGSCQQEPNCGRDRTALLRRRRLYRESGALFRRRLRRLWSSRTALLCRSKLCSGGSVLRLGWRSESDLRGLWEDRSGLLPRRKLHRGRMLRRWSVLGRRRKLWRRAGAVSRRYLRRVWRRGTAVLSRRWLRTAVQRGENDLRWVALYPLRRRRRALLHQPRMPTRSVLPLRLRQRDGPTAQL